MKVTMLSHASMLVKDRPLSFLYRYIDIGFQDNDVFNQTQKVGKDRVMEKASTQNTR
jgi:hypothetical protein